MRESPGDMADQLAAVKTPGDKRYGCSGQTNPDSQRIDHSRTMAFILDQEEQAAEQADQGRKQEKDYRGFEHA